MNRRTRTIQLAAGLSISCVALWLVVRRLDLDRVGALLSHASPLWLSAGVLALAAGYTLRVLRWWLMLRAIGCRVSPTAAAGPLLAGMALNNVLPFRAGDVARAFAFRRQLDASPAQVGSFLFVERLLDLLALLVILFAGLSGVEARGHFADIRAAAVMLTALAGLALALAILCPAQGRRFAEAITQLAFLRTRRFLPALRTAISQAFDALAVLRSPRVALLLLVSTAGAWLFEGLMYALLGRALSIDFAGSAPLLALALGNLATLIPSSPGYIGTFDYFVAAGFQAYGTSNIGAAAMALLIHSTLWLPVTLSGGIYLWHSRISAAGADGTTFPIGQVRNAG